MSDPSILAAYLDLLLILAPALTLALAITYALAVDHGHA